MSAPRCSIMILIHLKCGLEVIRARSIDIVSLDPFIKFHSVEENGNSAIDDVMQILTDLASGHDIAVDVPHHASKGPADPGNATSGNGTFETR